MPTVLLVCADSEIAMVVSCALEARGQQVHVAAECVQGMELFQRLCPDLVVIAENVPREVEEACSKLRKLSNVPVIVLGTSPGRGVSLARILEAGADVYLCPLDTQEFVLRAESLLRRYGAKEEIIHLDPDRLEATVGGKTVGLTLKEFSLLALLLFYRGRAVPSEEILQTLWGGALSTRALQFHARRLKQKLALGEDAPLQLMALRGVGYGLLEPRNPPADGSTLPGL